MASPFRFFRRHQKTFLVIAAVVAMFVFVLGDALMGFLGRAAGGSARSATSTVVSWEGGSLNVQELDILTTRRYFISEFLRRLQTTGAQRVLADGGTPLKPNVPDFMLQEGVSQRDVQIGVVTTRVLAELAQQAGMTVSDAVINHFLRETSFRRVNETEIASLLQGLGRGELRANEARLFSGLRELLLGHYYFSSFGASLRSVMPEERWEDWRRINHRIAVEAAILPTAQFLSQTPDPGDSDLLGLYEQFKENVGGIPRFVFGKQLPSPDPGFQQPRRVRLHYLLGDVNAWTDSRLDAVAEEEIADYYERNKRTQFVRTGTATTESTTTEATPDETAPATNLDTKSEEPEAVEENPVEENSIEKNTEEPNAGEEADGAKSEAPAEEEANENAEAADAEEADESSEQPDETSGKPLLRPFQLVAFQTEDDGDKSVEEGDVEEEDDATNADVPSKESDTKESDTEELDAEELDTKEPAADEKPVEYEPLENVVDQIRRQLAQDKAVVELQRVMERAYAEMETEYNRYGSLVVAAKSKGSEPPKPPAKLADLDETAHQSELVFEKTTLLSQMGLSETLVGKAVDAQSGRQLIVHAAFADLELYDPVLAQDRLDGNWYLIVKVEDVPSRVPPLDEIREEVAAAWKQREAAKLALAKAEQLAKEAQEAAEPLAEFLADKDYEVVITDLFSWLTFGTTPMDMRRGARLGEAPPLTAVGEEFMAQAFQLGPDQVVGLLNYDQTNAYVIRLDRRELTEEEMRSLFLAEANQWFGGQIMTMARWQRSQGKLLEQLTDRLGLDLSKLEEFFLEEDR